MGLGIPIHGESITDGDASGGIAVTLFEAGNAGTTTRTLATTEFLVVTDIDVSTEDGGDISLVADSKAAGRYLVHGNYGAGSGVSKHLIEPYVCPKGKGLKFYGVAANLDSCLIQGYIKSA